MDKKFDLIFHFLHIIQEEYVLMVSTGKTAQLLHCNYHTNKFIDVISSKTMALQFKNNIQLGYLDPVDLSLCITSEITIGYCF